MKQNNEHKLNTLILALTLGWRLRRVPYGVYGKGLFEDIAVEARF